MPEATDNHPAMSERKLSKWPVHENGFENLRVVHTYNGRGEPCLSIQEFMVKFGPHGVTAEERFLLSEYAVMRLYNDLTDWLVSQGLLNGEKV